jgi:hypothetical protein
MAAGAGAPAVGLLALWGVLTACHNPNRGDASRRLAAARARAYRPADVDRLTADRQYRQAAEDGRTVAGRFQGWLAVCGVGAALLLAAAAGTGWVPARAALGGDPASPRAVLARLAVPIALLAFGVFSSYLAGLALGRYRRLMRAVRNLETRQTWRAGPPAPPVRAGR